MYEEEIAIPISNTSKDLMTHVENLKFLYERGLVVALGIEATRQVNLLYARVILKGDGVLGPPTIRVPKPFILRYEIFSVDQLESICNHLESDLEIEVSSQQFELMSTSDTIWGSRKARWEPKWPPEDNIEDMGNRGSGIRVNFVSSYKMDTLLRNRSPEEKDLDIILRESSEGPINNVPDLLEQVFGSSIDTSSNSAMVSFIARTGVHIHSAGVSDEGLSLSFKCPKAICSRIGTIIALLTPGGLGTEIPLSTLISTEKDDNGSLERTTYVYDTPEIIKNEASSDSSLKVTLIDSQTQTLLASRIFPAFQMPAIIPSFGIFGRIQHLVHSRLQHLNEDILIELNETITKHELGATQTTPRLVADSIRVIVQEILDSVIGPEMLEQGEAMPTVEQTRDRLSIILRWIRSTKGSSKSEIKLADETYDHFFYHSRDFMALDAKLLHRESLKVLRTDLDQLVFQLYAFLGVLFSLLDKAGYDWTS